MTWLKAFYIISILKIAFQNIFLIIIILIKRISRVPFYCTSWEHRVLYSNTQHTYLHACMHACTHTHTHVRWEDRHNCEDNCVQTWMNESRMTHTYFNIIYITDISDIDNIKIYLTKISQICTVHKRSIPILLPCKTTTKRWHTHTHTQTHTLSHTKIKLHGKCIS